ARTPFPSIRASRLVAAAAATAVARPAAAAVAAAIAAAIATALALHGLVDPQRASAELRAVERAHRLLRAVRVHLHEREAARAAGLAIRDHLHRRHRAVAAEQVPQVGLGGGEGDVSDVELLVQNDRPRPGPIPRALRAGSVAEFPLALPAHRTPGVSTGRNANSTGDTRPEAEARSRGPVRIGGWAQDASE